jgi:hypothetical protein
LLSSKSPAPRVTNSELPISASDVERSERKGSSREGDAIDDVEQLRLLFAASTLLPVIVLSVLRCGSDRFALLRVHTS